MEQNTNTQPILHEQRTIAPQVLRLGILLLGIIGFWSAFKINSIIFSTAVPIVVITGGWCLRKIIGQLPNKQILRDGLLFLIIFILSLGIKMLTDFINDTTTEVSLFSWLPPFIAAATFVSAFPAHRVTSSTSIKKVLLFVAIGFLVFILPLLFATFILRNGSY